jgi:hypothetical protein
MKIKKNLPDFLMAQLEHWHWHLMLSLVLPFLESKLGFFHCGLPFEMDHQHPKHFQKKKKRKTTIKENTI